MGGRDCLEMNCWMRKSNDGDSSWLTSSITFFYRAPKEVAVAALYAYEEVPSTQRIDVIHAQTDTVQTPRLSPTDELESSREEEESHRSGF